MQLWGSRIDTPRRWHRSNANFNENSWFMSLMMTSSRTKSHQVTCWIHCFPVGAPKSAERTKIGPLRRDVAGKDARSWDEVWDSEAPRPGIQCQTHTARCHCKYVKKYHIKSQKIAYVYDVKFLSKTYPKQNIRIIHFQHTTWYPILYPYYIPMICSLYLIIPDFTHWYSMYIYIYMYGISWYDQCTCDIVDLDMIYLYTNQSRYPM